MVWFPEAGVRVKYLKRERPWKGRSTDNIEVENGRPPKPNRAQTPQKLEGQLFHPLHTIFFPRSVGLSLFLWSLLTSPLSNQLVLSFHTSFWYSSKLALDVQNRWNERICRIHPFSSLYIATFLLHPSHLMILGLIMPFHCQRWVFGRLIRWRTDSRRTLPNMDSSACVSILRGFFLLIIWDYYFSNYNH